MKPFIQALIVSTLLLWLGGCGKGGGHDDHAEKEAPPDSNVTLSAAAIKQHGIEVGVVSQQILLPTFSAPARVAFNEETMAHVGALVNGRVITMKAHIGDTVKQDDVLFIIESPELGTAQNAYLQALDAESAAKPAIALAENNAGVAKAQAEIKAAESLLVLAENPAAINQAKADRDAAAATVELARNAASIAQAQGNLDAAKPVLQRTRELYESGKKLASSGALATAELKRRETAMQTATAEVQAAQAALDRAKAQQMRDLTSTEATVKGAEAALAQAKAQQVRDVAAAKGKFATGTASLKAAEAQKVKDLVEAKSALNTAQATVGTTRNRLSLFGMSPEAISTLAKTRQLAPNYTVRAPRDGTVVEREITLGENASSDQPHLLILADLSKVWVLIEISPTRAESLKAVREVTLVNPATGYQTSAKLDYISPVVDAQTRTVRARVELDNARGHWRPGQFLTALLPTGARATETLAVPAKAVQHVNGQPTVYIRMTDKENTFQAREVAVGAAVNGLLPVIAGLKPDEQIVISGSFLLKAELGKAGAGHDHSH
ncbi:MAG: efflux RND transporter periplasmic adaptor subunit [Verrucomicrobiota bacterium]|jgi:cobalt-zinc-cadmium efflux system membrane fusion protein|nr:efflux RND transporter periplasmic adaptor subunit [Verrucomicrobiota bacterium]